MTKQKRILSTLLIVIVLLSSINKPNIAFAETSEVRISTTSAVVTEGNYLYLSMRGTKQKVTWTSSNEYIATVSKDGKVTTNGTGSVTITATVGQKKYKCSVTVVPNFDPNYLTDRDIETVLAERDYLENFANDTLESSDSAEHKTKGLPTKKTILIGATYTLKLNDVKGTAKWTSSNKSIVAVSTKGKIRGVKKGSATITATVGNKKYTCKVTVSPKLLFTDKNSITTTVGKKVTVIITLKTDLEDSVSAKLADDENIDDIYEYVDIYGKTVATYKYGDWDGYKLPIYITTKSKGKTNLVITSQNTNEKIVIPIVVK